MVLRKVLRKAIHGGCLRGETKGFKSAEGRQSAWYHPNPAILLSKNRRILGNKRSKAFVPEEVDFRRLLLRYVKTGPNCLQFFMYGE